MMAEDFSIGGVVIKPGSRQTVNIAIPQLYTSTPMDMPVHVVRGKQDGPRLVVSAAIHGDELNGVEVIRRLMKSSSLKRLRGTLIAIPIVNVYGVIHRSRYLPDRRDLNRSFPGSETGSLTSRFAHLILNEVFAGATHAIDLHTGAISRSNLPQIRADLNNPEVKKLARAFAAPVMINSKLRDGSLRQAASDMEIAVLMYEGGEALRFDEISIRTALRGVMNVMRELEMVAKSKTQKKPVRPIEAQSSTWARAPASGILLNSTALGVTVNKGDILASVADPFGSSQEDIVARKSGVVVGRTHLPLVNEGDAVIHIAHFDDVDAVGEHVSEFQEMQQRAIDSDDLISVI